MAEALAKEDAAFLPASTYNATCNTMITAGVTLVFVDVDKQTCDQYLFHQPGEDYQRRSG